MKNDNYYDYMIYEPINYYEQGRSYKKKMRDQRNTLMLIFGMICGWPLYELLYFMLEVFK